MLSLNVNQQTYQVDADPNMPLLWVIRDIIGLTGTKYGCGVAQCGACTVHLNDEAVRSCVTKVSQCGGAKGCYHRRLVRKIIIIRCNRHGSKLMYRNADIVIRAN